MADVSGGTRLNSIRYEIDQEHARE